MQDPMANAGRSLNLAPRPPDDDDDDDFRIDSQEA
jgi:hypothetical protein